MDSVLVIARKFNDILYALSIDELKNAKHKVLVIITQNQNKDSFPLQEKFDEIHFIEYSDFNSVEIIKQLKAIKNIRTTICTGAILSNPTLLINQLLIKRFKAKNIIFLEDGLMNYYNFKPSNSISKRVLQFIFGINQNKLFKKIRTTYLLAPQLAKFYFGRREKLNMDPTILTEVNFPNLEGKKIFVGQNLYLNYYHVCSVEEYNTQVNKFIRENKIDYYIPHPLYSKLENIECPKLDLYRYKVTLEYCASKYNFEIFSHSSSVLYTTKLINPKIKSYGVKFPFSGEFNYPSILTKVCDEILNI